jgi:hypothetical protein
MEETANNNFSLTQSGMTQRRTFFARAQSRLNIPLPEPHPIKLEGGEKVIVYRFDVKEKLARHLVSPVYGDLSDLALPDADNCWSSFPTTTDNSCLTRSRWYKDTCEVHREELLGGKTLLHPLTIYIDKTGVDRIQKNALEPLVCTSSLLSAKAKRDPKNWFVLGYVPNLEVSSSANRKKRTSAKKFRSINCRDYHRCLEVLLQPLIELQQGKHSFLFRRGDQVARFKMLCPISTVLGDNLSQNKLCGKMSNTAASCVRMSRCCLTPHFDCDTLPHECILVDGPMVHRLSMASIGCTYGHMELPYDGLLGLEQFGPRIHLQNHPVSSQFDSWRNYLSENCDVKETAIYLRKKREAIADKVLNDVFVSHAVDNAFSSVDFGADADIHQATMADLMHTVEEGIFRHVVNSVIGLLPNSDEVKVDNLVQEMFCQFGNNRSGERPNYPRVSFTRGFCSLTLLSNDERVGQLFVIALLLNTKRGREVLGPRFHENFDGKPSVAADAAPATAKTSKKKKRQTKTFQLVHPPERNRIAGLNSLGLDSFQRKLLKVINLQYLETHCLPCLPPHHQSILKTILLKELRVTKDKYRVDIDDYDLQLPGCMDYKQLPPFSPGLPRRRLKDFSTRMRPVPIKLPVERAHCSIRCSMEQLTRLLEQLLMSHAFHKDGGALLTDMESIEKYDRSFVSMLWALQACIRRDETHDDFRFQKFLEWQHMKTDHLRYGPTADHNTDTGERGLKTWAKAVAVTAQNRGDDIFKGQVARNSQEVEILDIIESSCLFRRRKELGLNCTVMATDSETGSSDEAPLIGVMGKSFFFTMTQTSSSIHAVDRRGKVCGTPKVVFDPQITQCLDNYFRQKVDMSNRNRFTVQLVSEITMIDEGRGKRDIVRAHPNYRGQGCWYDYVSVDYGVNGYHPARVAIFFLWPHELPPDLSGFDYVQAGDAMVVLQESEYQEGLQLTDESIMCSHHTLQHTSVITPDGHRRSATLKVHPSKTISRRIFAFNPNPNDGGPFFRESSQFEIVVVKDKQVEWPAIFLESHQIWDN